MNMTDPIADMLTRIRNGVQARMETVDVAPYSRVKAEIARILKAEGYIENYAVEGEGIEKKIVVTLKYAHGQSVISGIKRISKPGLRVYAKGDEVPKVLNGLGTAIISTSNGMMTDRDARKQHIGGEVVAYIW
ncbi:MAG: 30S ribosomal protein S8 [Solobacterium sp.]|jgi:small subunit ribosomal protein S8|nr:30S ribosomal protein S8 [Solobacterium sp.]MCH4048929.1 30S ribosomal protein S8 [Solobacterium sp.]MCH4074317.1 30S ribosomal protein S8 [Solobacterium sp.]MCI1314085.1 30S ribosomal protein S8 [Solobacterium sp.]MCI1346279.1 30S ribosomal protein S8 [Solobacterium sp.]